MQRRSFPCIVVLAAAALTAHSVAQEQAASPLPLTFGTRWVYAQSWRDALAPAKATTTTTTKTITSEASCEAADGLRLHQVRIDVPDTPTTFTVYSVRDDGVYRHPSKNAAQRGTVDTAAAPMRLLALPAGSTKTWSWRGPLVHDGTGNAGEWSHSGEWLGQENVQVGAGTFRADHARITSERDGKQRTHDLWFAPDVGIVREVHVDSLGEQITELRELVLGAGPGTERLVKHVEDELKNRYIKAFNNKPGVTWLEAGPEALVLPGHIAIVHTDAWSACYYVGPDAIEWFDPRDTDLCSRAVRAAFGTKDALPPADAPAEALALLLARSHAGRLQLGRVRAVAPKLAPKRKLPEDGERTSVEVIGGALDGTDQRIAVWLTLDPRSRVSPERANIHLVSDGPEPVDSLQSAPR